MIQFMIFFIVVCLIAYDSAVCDQKAIACSVVCTQDGDQKGFLVDGKCYCANERDLSRVPTLVSKRAKVILPPPKAWGDE